MKTNLPRRRTVARPGGTARGRVGPSKLGGDSHTHPAPSIQELGVNVLAAEGRVSKPAALRRGNLSGTLAERRGLSRKERSMFRHLYASVETFIGLSIAGFFFSVLALDPFGMVFFAGTCALTLNELRMKLKMYERQAEAMHFGRNGEDHL